MLQIDMNQYSGEKSRAGAGKPRAWDMDDPFDLLLRDHETQWRMCGWLEEIADGLPGNASPALCRKAALCLRDDMPLHHREEEEALFPLLLARVEPADMAHDIIGRLREEHVNDLGFAEELVDILLRMESGAEVENPDMLGYMLRGFFENYRRHIHWENTILIPLARKRLTGEDVAEMLSRMRRLRGQARG